MMVKWIQKELWKRMMTMICINHRFTKMRYLLEIRFRPNIHTKRTFKWWIKKFSIIMMELKNQCKWIRVNLTIQSLVDYGCKKVREMKALKSKDKSKEKKMYSNGRLLWLIRTNSRKLFKAWFLFRIQYLGSNMSILMN